ncbi:MAG: SHOCT domain-containing protein [Chloroflexota bacterium]
MDEKPVAVLNGVGGQIEVYPNKVRIRRKGVIAKMSTGFFSGEKDIYFSQIGSVLVKRAGMLTNGWIKFVVSGGVDIKKGLLASTKDENTVHFRIGAQAETVDWIRQYVESQMAGGGMGPAQSAPLPDTADQLRQLAELRDAGLLTPDEYEEKRRELVARL